MKERPPDGDGRESRDESRGANGFPDRAFFRGKGSREILDWLFERDPLGIEALCSRRWQELCLFVDPERLVIRALVKTARGAADGGLDPVESPEDWLAEQVDASIEELLDEDVEAELVERPPDTDEARHYAALAELTDADPGLARRLCIAFNGLPIAWREPFFDVVVAGIALERYAAETDTPPGRVRARIERTIREIVRRAQELDPARPDTWIDPEEEAP